MLNLCLQLPAPVKIDIAGLVISKHSYLSTSVVIFFFFLGYVNNERAIEATEPEHENTTPVTSVKN